MLEGLKVVRMVTALKRVPQGLDGAAAVEQLRERHRLHRPALKQEEVWQLEVTC